MKRTNRTSRKNRMSISNRSSNRSSNKISNKISNSEPLSFDFTGGVLTHFLAGVSHANHHIMYLNNSKFFAGIVMILLNVGSKFITIQFSKSTEEYMKLTITKQILVFSMAWMGTRDIYTALGLTAVFTILSEHLFNEESHLCIVPHEYRILHKLLDTNNIPKDQIVKDQIAKELIAKDDPLKDITYSKNTNNNGQVTDQQFAAATAIIEKVKREKEKEAQKKAFAKFDFYKYNYNLDSV